MPVFQFCNCLVSTKHDGFGKRLCPSGKINYTASYNISLYCDTKEVIYRYTQNVYRPISIHSIDPSYSKGILTIVIAKLGTISSSIGLSHRMDRHNPGMAD